MNLYVVRRPLAGYKLHIRASTRTHTSLCGQYTPCEIEPKHEDDICEVCLSMVEKQKLTENRR